MKHNSVGRFSIRKLSVGVASVVIGLAFIGTSQTAQVHAANMDNATTEAVNVDSTDVKVSSNDKIEPQLQANNNEVSNDSKVAEVNKSQANDENIAKAVSNTESDDSKTAKVSVTNETNNKLKLAESSDNNDKKKDGTLTRNITIIAPEGKTFSDGSNKQVIVQKSIKNSVYDTYESFEVPQFDGYTAHVYAINYHNADDTKHDKDGKVIVGPELNIDVRFNDKHFYDREVRYVKDPVNYSVHVEYINDSNDGKPWFEHTYSVKEGASLDLKIDFLGFKLMNPEALDHLTMVNSSYNGTRFMVNKNIDKLELHYKKLANTKVQYVDEDGNLLLEFNRTSKNATSESPYASENGVHASVYLASAIDIPGYELVSDKQVSFKYEKVGNDTNLVKFVYKKLTPSADKGISGQLPGTKAPENPYAGQLEVGQKWGANWKPIGPSFNIDKTHSTYGQGNYEENVKKFIDEYGKKGYTWIDNVLSHKDTDMMNRLEGAGQVGFYANKPVVVRYVDENGKTISETVVLSANPNNPDQTNSGINLEKGWHPEGKWSSESKNIDGYTLDHINGVTSGNYSNFTYFVTYVYKKNGTETPDVPDTPTDNVTPDPIPNTPETPTTPSEPDTSVTPQPQTPENNKPQDPGTPTNPSEDSTTVPHSTKVEQNKSDKKIISTNVKKTFKSEAIQNVAQKERGAILPQTGEKKSMTGLLGFLISTLGIFGLARKRKHN